jgi:hypothetical protein
MSYPYIANPITGRPIIIGGDTFNRIVMESHDYIDGRLVRRQTAPPPEEQPVYLNTDTGRYVRRGTRTYHRLIESDYIRKFYSAKNCVSLRFCKFTKVYGIIFRKISKYYVSLQFRKIYVILRLKYYVSFQYRKIYAILRSKYSANLRNCKPA